MNNPIIKVIPLEEFIKNRSVHIIDLNGMSLKEAKNFLDNYVKDQNESR